MNTTTYVIIRLQVEGLHRWPNAARQIPEVAYLSDLHRHIFHIEIKRRVYHDDRDIEFIEFKRKVKQYLTQKYFDAAYNCLNFYNMSCESIAKELLEAFKADYVMVTEDNENGAEIFLG